MGAARRRRADAPRTPEVRGPAYARLRTRDIYGGATPPREGEDLTLLAASIKRRGLLSPLVVRRNEEAGRYALVCGARRLAACRMLGMEEVDALIVEGDERDALCCFLEEHWTRREVSCADEAEAICRLGGRETAERLALPARAALRRLRLRLLGERVLGFVRRAGLTLEQAEPLLCVPDEGLRLEAATIIAGRSLSGEQARRLVLGAGGAGARPLPGAGKRRATRMALGEISAAVARLRARGVDASVSVHSQEGGLCVQIALRSGEPEARAEREKKPEKKQEKKRNGEN